MAQVVQTRLWLTGLYGCLTSWIGHAVGATSNSRFIDGDETVAEMAGLTPLELARIHKSDRHDWNSCFVRCVTSEPGNIVASVPACVADHEDNTQLLVLTGTLVYLRLSPDLLLTYATSDPRQHRSELEVRAWLGRVLDRRDQALFRAAHHVIDVAGASGADAKAAAAVVNRRLRAVQRDSVVPGGSAGAASQAVAEVLLTCRDLEPR